MKKKLFFLLSLFFLYFNSVIAVTYNSEPKIFIQELVDIGIKVHCVIIESGWKEIDTVEDYKKALVGFNKKFTKS